MAISGRGRFPLGAFMVMGVFGFALAGCADSPVPTPVPTSRPPEIATPTQRPTETRSPTAAPTEPPATVTATPVTPVEGSALELIRAFIDAPYRVVAVAKNPFAPYSLIVATERSAADCGSPEMPQRCTSDETCGSLYT